MSVLSFAFDDVLSEGNTIRATNMTTTRSGLSASRTLAKHSMVPTLVTPLSARKNSCASGISKNNRPMQTIDFTFKSVKARSSRANVHNPKNIDFTLMVDKSVDTNELELERAHARRDAPKPKHYLLSECNFDYPTNLSYNSSDVIAMMNLMENDDHAKLLCVETIDDMSDTPDAGSNPATICSVTLDTTKRGYDKFNKMNAFLAKPRK